MSTFARHHDALHKLEEHGSLPQSACSAALRRCLTSLLDGGVLAWERSGAGQRLIVRNTRAFAEFLSQTFPHSQQEAAGLASRIQGVARFRDSKALKSDSPEIVTVRGLQNGMLHCNNEPIDIATCTRTHGVFAFALHEDAYHIRGHVALVENPAMFIGYERLNARADMAIYACGRVSDRLVDWLTACADGLHLVHLGDYDPVGLSEYLRLRKRLGNHVSFYEPANLSDLFRRYAKADLLRKPNSQTLLRRLRDSNETVVKRVIALMDEFNGGLEQEALLVNSR